MGCWMKERPRRSVPVASDRDLDYGWFIQINRGRQHVSQFFRPLDGPDPRLEATRKVHEVWVFKVLSDEPIAIAYLLIASHVSVGAI